MSLRGRAFAAVRWSAAITGMRVLLQVAQLAALTRILTPADYGLVAIASATLSFAQHFSDLGLNSALVQRRDVSTEQRSSLYWANLATAGVVALTMALAGVGIARWMSDDRLGPLIALCSVVVLVQASAAQLRAQAEKDLEFRAVVLIELAALLVAVGASILLARMGLGATSIVLGTLLGALLTALCAWAWLRRGWRPQLRLRMAEVRPFLGFGGRVVVNHIVNHVNLVADIFIGNRLLGPALMGLYAVPRNLALQIQDSINPIVTRVGFPLIAQLQADRAQVANVYLRTMRMTSSVNAPVYLFVFVFAPDIVALLLGADWQQSATILRILALWGAVRSTANPVGSLLLGVGRADLSLHWNLALLAVVPAVVWIGAGQGVVGLATSLLLLQLALFVPAWYFLVHRTCGAGLPAYAKAALAPMLHAAGAGAAAVAAAAPFEGSVARLAIGAVVLTAAYLGASLRWNTEWLAMMLEMAGAHRLKDRLAARRTGP